MLQESVYYNRENAQGKAYSQGLKLGDFIYISGTLPVDEKDQVVTEDTEAQARKVFANIQTMLESCGMELCHIVKMNVMLTDIQDADAVDRVMKDVFSEPYPARTISAVAGLEKNARIMIDGYAVDTRALEVLCSECNCDEDGDEEGDHDHECCDGKTCSF